MKIAIGSDHGGYELKTEIANYLEQHNYEVLDLGTHSLESVDYPAYGVAVGRAVTTGQAELGIVVCGTGLGISMAANKVAGVRAAVCTDTYSARMAREHNNANILALGGRVTGVGLALDIVEIFCKTPFAAGRHSRRVEMIMAVERGEEIPGGEEA